MNRWPRGPGRLWLHVPELCPLCSESCRLKNVFSWTDAVSLFVSKSKHGIFSRSHFVERGAFLPTEVGGAPHKQTGRVPKSATARWVGGPARSSAPVDSTHAVFRFPGRTCSLRGAGPLQAEDSHCEAPWTPLTLLSPPAVGRPVCWNVPPQPCVVRASRTSGRWGTRLSVGSLPSIAGSPQILEKPGSGDTLIPTTATWLQSLAAGTDPTSRARTLEGPGDRRPPGKTTRCSVPSCRRFWEGQI